VPSGASRDRGEQGHCLRGAACQSTYLIGGVGSRQDVRGLPSGAEHDRPERPIIFILTWDLRIHVAGGTCDLNAGDEELPFGEGIQAERPIACQNGEFEP
jgi:hypothetical protein